MATETKMAARHYFENQSRIPDIMFPTYWDGDTFFSWPICNKQRLTMERFETGVTTTISKLIKTCVLRVTPSALYFILSEKLVNGGVQIWCELPQGHFFDEYAMEGVSAEANEIYLEMSPENLVKALRTAQAAKWVKVKLTKKHSPCLTVEVDLPTIGQFSRVVMHDIPVSVVPRRLWPEYSEPEVPQFDTKSRRAYVVTQLLAIALAMAAARLLNIASMHTEVSIVMPQMKVLRNIVDKMKNLSNCMTLGANHQGELKMSVETDMVSVSTHFQDLLNPTSRDEDGSQSQGSDDPQQYSEAKIDIRRFAQFLTGQQMNPSRVICNIVDNRVVHFYLMNDDVSLQYFMPVMFS